MKWIVLVVIAALAGAQNTGTGGISNTGDVQFLDTRCCVPQLGTCTTGLPLCTSLGCCDPRFMTCPPGVSICTYDPSVFCCNTALTKCPAGVPICGTPTITAKPCCDPARQSCGDFSAVCPTTTCCNALLNKCPAGAPICEGTNATPAPSNSPCCDPSRQTCADFSNVCSTATCCNTALNRCPTDAPICGASDGSAPATFSPAPSFATCCDPSKQICPAGVPLCNSAATVGPCCDPAHQSCPGFANVCPTATCCNSRLNLCPADVPICSESESTGGSRLPERPTIETSRMPETPRPSQSSLPKPFPSRSAVPTPFPTRPAGASAPPTPRPRFPEPTRFVVKLPSPAPSRWPRPSREPRDEKEKPTVITAALSMIGANRTEFTRPEKLQEIQIQLGCALRIPTENILIRKIFEVTAAGVKTEIPFDPSITNLNSYGTVMCVSGRGRLLQSISGSGSGSVDIDYTVYDPTPDIVALTPTEFSTIVSSSSAIQEFSASVGASAVSNSAPAELATAPTTAGSRGSGSVSLGVGVGVPIGIALIVAGVVVIRSQRRKSHRIATSREVQRTVVVNPYTMNTGATAVTVIPQVPSGTTESNRKMFTPNLARGTGV